MKQATKPKSLLDLAKNQKNYFVVIRKDETEFWRDDLQRRGKKIEGVYLVNLKEPTHLCELAVSFPATHLRNFVHNSQAFTEDELLEMEMDNAGDDVSYFSGYSVFEVVKIYNKPKDFETIKEAEEQILEHERGNPSYC